MGTKRPNYYRMKDAVKRLGGLKFISYVCMVGILIVIVGQPIKDYYFPETACIIVMNWRGADYSSDTVCSQDSISTLHFNLSIKSEINADFDKLLNIIHPGQWSTRTRTVLLIPYDKNASADKYLGDAPYLQRNYSNRLLPGYTCTVVEEADGWFSNRAQTESFNYLGFLTLSLLTLVIGRIVPAFFSVFSGHFTGGSLQEREHHSESFIPPQVGERLLLLVLTTKEERVNIPGDLEEEFKQIAAKHGTRYAKLWYYKQVAASAWPMIRKAVRWGLVSAIGMWIRRFI